MFVKLFCRRTLQYCIWYWILPWIFWRYKNEKSGLFCYKVEASTSSIEISPPRWSLMVSEWFSFDGWNKPTYDPYIYMYYICTSIYSRMHSNIYIYTWLWMFIHISMDIYDFCKYVHLFLYNIYILYSYSFTVYIYISFYRRYIYICISLSKPHIDGNILLVVKVLTLSKNQPPWQHYRYRAEETSWWSTDILLMEEILPTTW